MYDCHSTGRIFAFFWRYRYVQNNSIDSCIYEIHISLLDNCLDKDNCIAVYPFTAPVYKIIMEDYFLHALTETGLESYTLRIGHQLCRNFDNIDSTQVVSTNWMEKPRYFLSHYTNHSSKYLGNIWSNNFLIFLLIFLFHWILRIQEVWLKMLPIQ